MSGNPEEVLQKQSYEYSLDIIRFVQQLKEQKVQILASQVLRTGTNIGAHVEEALVADDKEDMQKLLNLARKEARKTHYWLRLLRDAELVSKEQAEEITVEAAALVRMLGQMLDKMKG